MLTDYLFRMISKNAIVNKQEFPDLSAVQISQVKKLLKEGLPETGNPEVLTVD